MPLNARVPEPDDLMNLEDAFRNSVFKRWFEYQEEKFFERGYLTDYDTQVSLYCWQLGFRYEYNGIGYGLNLNLVPGRVLNLIQRWMQRTTVQNPYKRRRYN